MLAGIVNRMDRAYVSEASCGEIRLIYRLTRINTQAADNTASPRLPMTLNLVLKAKVDHKVDRDGSEITCSGIANRWLAAGELSPAGAQLAEKLAAKDNPLDLIGYQNIDRIETNLQIAHAPKSAVRDFRTDYLLKVFRYDRQAGSSRKRRWKTRSIAIVFWPTTISGATSPRGSSTPNISPNSIAARF